ncbi:hypothetical protein CYLTODRAFT_459442 [Cylindrobasidium torrendii FP15055 ss-10]|uniref:Uncharacterized protein n=1 Tax=Cylindrobasidium torrendii FP15055 ss-10 TaxID=1314674 RepID=A0A0D7AXB6_9AGAR|nr:hypothetical protein CYLTODRAFT_459442 [Cylindrobasidium torrendii FP15055 ss-10]
MSSGATAQDKSWKAKEQGAEAAYAHQKELEKIAALKADLNTKTSSTQTKDKNFEGGFGGQEDLEDRYATTSGDH